MYFWRRQGPLRKRRTPKRLKSKRLKRLVEGFPRSNLQTHERQIFFHFFSDSLSGGEEACDQELQSKRPAPVIQSNQLCDVELQGAAGWNGQPQSKRGRPVRRVVQACIFERPPYSALEWPPGWCRAWLCYSQCACRASFKKRDLFGRREHFQEEDRERCHIILILLSQAILGVLLCLHWACTTVAWYVSQPAHRC